MRAQTWIEGLEWIRKDTSDMPIVDNDPLRVDKPVEAEIMAECYLMHLQRSLVL